MPTCSGPNCGAEIVWAVTEKGKRVPLDAKPEKRYVVGPLYEPDDDQDQSGLYVIREYECARIEDVFMPHHATCPDVGNFRKAASA